MVERMSDLELIDRLATMRDRTFALECAITGADTLKVWERQGLTQLASDVTNGMQSLCTDWNFERKRRQVQAGVPID